ncbi:MAG: amino acid ABC transporter permease [Lachnospiraceae bacterium]|nr:amino acid ABC transporter permease [Lachnospiraceae bacterium]
MLGEVTITLLQGFGKTLELFALTLLFALPLGLLICFGSMSRVKILSAIINAIIWVIRGTPLMLQLLVIYYGPGIVSHQQIGFTNSTRFLAALIAFVINYACYFAVIYRGGIQSVPVGQREAGKVLGMTNSQIFRKIVFLQVIKNIIPPISNEIITLVKDTSLARVIAVYEIIWAGETYIKHGGLIWPLFYTGVFYLVFSALLTWIFNKTEKKLAYF